MDAGNTLAVMPAFEVQAFLKVITDERINLLVSVPAVYWLAINQPNFKELDRTRVQWISYGGAPIAPELVARIKESFPNARVGNGFGLTETSSVTTFLPHEYADSRPETVGFRAPVVDLDLFEPDPETGVGELLVRGSNVVRGYWNKPEATADAFVNHWLHTGDMARIDGDGFVEIVDRKKDMICRGGENVYSVEVENILAAHPAVFEVAVIGVPDEVMGEKVGAVLVAKPGHQIDADDVLSFARKHLADFKVPQYVSVRAEPMPRNPGGKMLKPVLRKQTEWGRPVR
jgi:acyl-CoA synthetase (AMP-forming)/AMP-acid ligase II